jgi:hypothetical protein
MGRGIGRDKGGVGIPNKNPITKIPVFAFYIYLIFI